MNIYRKIPLCWMEADVTNVENISQYFFGGTSLANLDEEQERLSPSEPANVCIWITMISAAKAYLDVLSLASRNLSKCSWRHQREWSSITSSCFTTVWCRYGHLYGARDKGTVATPVASQVAGVWMLHLSFWSLIKDTVLVNFILRISYDTISIISGTGAAICTAAVVT
jgi:hypothetical protein